MDGLKNVVSCGLNEDGQSQRACKLFSWILHCTADVAMWLNTETSVIDRTRRYQMF